MLGFSGTVDEGMVFRACVSPTFFHHATICASHEEKRGEIREGRVKRRHKISRSGDNFNKQQECYLLKRTSGIVPGMRLKGEQENKAKGVRLPHSIALPPDSTPEIVRFSNYGSGHGFSSELTARRWADPSLRLIVRSRVCSM